MNINGQFTNEYKQFIIERRDYWKKTGLKIQFRVNGKWVDIDYYNLDGFKIYNNKMVVSDRFWAEQDIKNNSKSK